jgi:hypothetical protein
MYDGDDHVPMTRDDFMRLHVIEWGAPIEIGPYTLTTRRTLHHIPTAALRVTDARGAEDGATWSYSCDTAFDPELVDWLAEGADRIFHETSFGPAHTPLDELEGLPEEVRERMVVVHLPDQLLEVDSSLEFAEQGWRYHVG